MSLFGNSRGITIPDMQTGESAEGLGWALYMVGEHKEGRVQLESVKIKNKWRPGVKIP